METLSINYCRVCGSDLSPEEEICTKCGGVQFFRRKETSPVLLVILIFAGFVAVVLLGFLSAVSIPKLSSLRADACNAAALKNAVGAKLAAESYFSRNGTYPATVEQLGFRTDNGIYVSLTGTGARRCTLVVAHVNGNMEFSACPGEDRILSRERNAPGARFVPVR